MKSLTGIMENVTAYRLWQAPFAEKKLAPLLRRSDLARARRVLDVGCGPGTNAGHFGGAEYLGIDQNPDYIAYARRRFGRPFVVADVRTYAAEPGARFDFILVNSLLHHLDEASTHQILTSLASLLTPDGHVHVLELVLPARRGLARLLAQSDRGDYPRELEKWEAIFGEHFDPVLLEPYPVGVFGIPLWDMLYLKGRSLSTTAGPRLSAG